MNKARLFLLRLQADAARIYAKKAKAGASGFNPDLPELGANKTVNQSVLETTWMLIDARHRSGERMNLESSQNGVEVYTSIEPGIYDEISRFNAVLLALNDGKAFQVIIDQIPELREQAKQSQNENLIVPLESENDGFYSPSNLAKRHGVTAESLRKRLKRFREKSHSGWVESENRKARKPRFLFSECKEVLEIVKDLHDKMSSKRPA